MLARIEVLSQWSLISGSSDVVIGRHGLVLERSSGPRTILLPRYANDRALTAEAFIEAAFAKAGVDRHSPRAANAAISVFTTTTLEMQLGDV